MITMAMCGKVRRMCSREHLSISEIVRQPSLSRAAGGTLYGAHAFGSDR